MIFVYATLLSFRHAAIADIISIRRLRDAAAMLIVIAACHCR